MATFLFISKSNAHTFNVEKKFLSFFAALVLNFSRDIFLCAFFVKLFCKYFSLRTASSRFFRRELLLPYFSLRLFLHAPSTCFLMAASMFSLFSFTLRFKIGFNSPAIMGMPNSKSTASVTQQPSARGSIVQAPSIFFRSPAVC